MKQRQPLQPLAVFSDLSERIYYNQPDLPLYTRNDALSRFDFSMACHWHRDLEFVHALTGSMKYFVNGAIVDIPTGDGLFVNSILTDPRGMPLPGGRSESFAVRIIMATGERRTGHAVRA